MVPIGPSVGHRAPGHPAAPLQEDRQRPGGALDAGIGGHGEDLGAGLEQQPPVGLAAAVQAGDGHALQLANVPDTRSTASSGPMGKSASMAEARPGSSTNATTWAWGTRWPTCLHQGTGPLAGGRAGHPEGEVGVEAGAVEGESQGDGPRERDLDRAPPVGHRGEEGPQPHEGVGAEPGIGERSLGIDGVVVDEQRAVVRHHHAGDPVGGLGDHAFAARAGRQRGGGGEPVLVAQHEVDGVRRVEVGQAADGGGQADRQRYETIVGHALPPPPVVGLGYGIASGAVDTQIFPHVPPAPVAIERWAFPPAGWVCCRSWPGPRFAATPRPPQPRRSAPPPRSACGSSGAATLAAALVPRTVTLTAVRIVAARLGGGHGMGGAGQPRSGAGRRGRPGLAPRVVTAVALSAGTGDAFANGSSYGDERRFPLRAPGGPAVGPIEVAWLVVVVGAAAGPLLLAAAQWVPGALVAAGGLARRRRGRRGPARPVAAVAGVHPGRRGRARSDGGGRGHVGAAPAPGRVAPGPADTTACDLTMGALGVALEIDLTEAIGITPRPARRPGQPAPPIESVDVAAVLVTPSRPGVVLLEAAERRLPVAA